MNAPENPYASPALETGPPPIPSASDEAEAIRRRYIKHEASVRSIGVLYYLAAIITGIATVGVIVATVSERTLGPLELIVTLLFCGGITALCAYGGRALRNLNPMATVPVGIISGIGLLNFPIGTLINAYILYLVFSAKGRYVLSRPYAEIIRQTPHVRYRSSALLIVLLIILGLVMAGMITFVWLGTV